MDLWWNYNNIWIKKENKWKVVFTTPEGEFEPMVMFFGLTNSPAIFQMMKYKWKVREVDFLEVVIGLEGIKRKRR